MATVPYGKFLVFLLSVLFLLFAGDVSGIPLGHHKINCDIKAIYQLGDSISDTGNFIREQTHTPFARFPYGETFFNRSTGRCSNGLLMLDFLANAVGLPLVNPYMDKNASFDHGVNFAVAGSTALESSFLAKQNIPSPVTNSSLLVQLDWLKSHLNSTCNTTTYCANNSTCNTRTYCAKKLEKALFIVGEIGGNDYNYAFFQRKTIGETQQLVPDVVQNIMMAAKEVIDLGATLVIVPGNFPIGCLPIYLTTFKNNDWTSYDHNKCLRGLNNFAWYHNHHLQRALTQLRKEYPNVVILYADYYNAYLWVLRNAAYLGFEKDSLHKACCGVGGDYSFDLERMCGTEGASVCSDPDTHMSWDGVHSTQKAYQYMAEWLILQLWPKSRCF